MCSLQAVLSLETALHHIVHPAIHCNAYADVLTHLVQTSDVTNVRACSIAGVGGVAQPTTAAAAIFGGVARSLLRASPRQLFRSLSRLLIRAARPMLTGPGSVVRCTKSCCAFT